MICLNDKDRQIYHENFSKVLEDIKTTTKKRNNGRVEGWEGINPVKERWVDKQGARFTIWSTHHTCLSQLIPQNKKSKEKRVSHFMRTKFYHTIVTINGTEPLVWDTKTTAKKKKDGRMGGQKSIKTEVSAQAGSKIYKTIHSPHLLSQLISRNKKSKEKRAILFMHAKFCHAIMTINEKEPLIWQTHRQRSAIHQVKDRESVDQQ